MMLRHPFLRVGGSVARTIACFADNACPSTSTTGSEKFGESFVVAPKELVRSEASRDKSASRLAEKQREHNDRMTATRNRIRRWRTRNHVNISEDPVNGDDGNGATRLSDSEWQSRVDTEEREWDQRAEELVRMMEDFEGDAGTAPGENLVENKAPAQRLQMTEADIELKRKTGKVKFRQIIYNEGELDGSDLTKPPSIDNPHPYDPSTMAPPVLSRSIVPFVNHMPLLQTLVDLGVNLFEIDTTTKLSRHLLRLDSEKDVKPKLQWLISIGFEPADLGDYLTRNPFFLIQNLDDMKTRVNYLESKKFTRDNIIKIVKEFRYWLNVDVKTMDARLGWIQRQFQLSGNNVRALVIKEPRVVMFGLGPLQRLVNLFNKELLFSPNEMKRMLLEDPRLFMMDAKYITSNYHFVHRVMRLPNDVIAEHPFILRCSISNLKNRHMFLRQLGRARYVGQQPPSSTDNSGPSSHNSDEGNSSDDVSLDDLLHPSDAIFANRAAKTYLVAYDKFLRSN